MQERTSADALSSQKTSVAWRRLLCIGLGASLLFHWAAMDMLRGAGSPRSAMVKDLGVYRLQASLDVRSAKPVLEKPIPWPIFKGVPEEARRPPAEPSASPVPMPAARVEEALVPPQAKTPAQEARVSEAGLRPLSVAEGLVAYRLALVQSLKSWPSAPPGPLVLRVVRERGEEHVRLELQNSSGLAAADQAWLSVMAAAAKVAVLPDVLAGRAFELALEFEP